MSKHTDGPWALGGSYGNTGVVICGPNNEVIAHVRALMSSTDAVMPWPQGMANAKLIIASPKLLKALQQLIAWEDGERTAVDALANARSIVAELIGGAA